MNYVSYMMHVGGCLQGCLLCLLLEAGWRLSVGICVIC